MGWIRSALWVPGHRQDWIASSLSHGADAVVLDLEDAVPTAEKDRARELVRAGIDSVAKSGSSVMVRINGIATGRAPSDLDATVVAGLNAVVVPKIEHPDDVRRVDAWLEYAESRAGIAVGSVGIIAVPETALGVQHAFAVATSSPRVLSVLGILSVPRGDIANSVGYRTTDDGIETLYMASRILLANKAAGIDKPLAGASLNFSNAPVATAHMTRLRDLGFRGALVVHPSLISIANEVFGPSIGELDWAAGVLRAMRDAIDSGHAAARFDGAMIDYAHVRQAQTMLREANSFGLQVPDHPEVEVL